MDIPTKELKKKAQAKAINAIHSRKLIRPNNCSNCGETTRIIAHHEDYTKPLEITWLCQSCHVRRHKHSVRSISKPKISLDEHLLYRSLRKLTRNKRIISYAKRHPELSQKEIGTKYGISESRVCVILRKYKHDTTKVRVTNSEIKIVSLYESNLAETRELVNKITGVTIK